MAQEIRLPLKAGSYVVLLRDTEVSAEGVKATQFFQDQVDQYVPETGLLRFEGSDITLSEFRELVEHADGYEVYLDP